MASYAYLRVSTDQQEVDNQRHGILEYCNTRKIHDLQFVEDSVSGKTNWGKRKLGDLLIKTMQTGDTIIFAEISRMARSTLQVLEILEHCANRKIDVHVAKQQMILDSSLQSQITATVLGLAAQIDREFCSMRTKEALAARQKQVDEQGYFISKEGKKISKLGRPKGQAKTVKLDAHGEEIRDYLAKGVSRASIAKLLGCSRNTLYLWVKRNNIPITRSHTK